MTISEFMNNFNIKKMSRIEKWLENGYIPGAYYDEQNEEWNIPNSAKPPYTKARAKKTPAVYRSIVNACLCRQHVFPKLYNIGVEEFDTYIHQLATAEIIEVKEIDGVTYYFSTLNSEKFVKCKNPEKFIKEWLAIIAEKGAEGITKGVVTNLLS